jgi:hypothetical protein
MEVRTSSVSLSVLGLLASTSPAETHLDKLEDSVLDLERRRITKEEGRKAQSAMQALEVKDTRPQPKSEDVDYIVGGSSSSAMFFPFIPVRTQTPSFPYRLVPLGLPPHSYPSVPLANHSPSSLLLHSIPTLPLSALFSFPQSSPIPTPPRTLTLSLSPLFPYPCPSRCPVRPLTSAKNT